MPDQNMPYYNAPDPQFGQNIPIPSQQMLDYSYLQNNQQIMYNGQNNVANTVRIAQDNFHRDMQNVLQGTMAAGMAVYNTGKSVVDKARETQYQDMLLNGGNYVLERGFMREAAWASGLAQSDFGRSLKLGGRRPEFMSQEELQFQMERSWHHRTSELGIETGGGAVAIGSSLLGMRLTKSMGLLKGSAVGIALDAVAGRIYDVGYAQPREYEREFRTMTEVTDLHGGVGQRRLTGSVSDQLARRFYDAEKNPGGFRYIPLIGDAIADRLAPDTKASEFIPKMMQAGLFRDQNLQDVDKMEKFIKDTISVVEKFAALANTTKDAILGLKGKLNQMGYNDQQQNAFIGNIVNTSMSTGLDLSTVASYGQMFSQMGLQSGLNKGIVAQSGLTELASVKALQEAGFIDRGLDPGSLAMRNTQRSIEFGQTGYGFVNRFNGQGFNGAPPSPQRSVDIAAAYLASRAGGSVVAGTVLMQDGMLQDSTDPNASLRKAAVGMYQEFIKNMSPAEAYAAVTRRLKPQSAEDRAQIRMALFQDGMGEMLAAGSASRKEADRTGDPTRLTSFSLNDVTPSNSLFGGKQLSIDIERTVNGIRGAKGYEQGSREESKFNSFKSMHGEKVKKMYEAILSGDITKADEIKKDIIKNAQGGTGDGNSYSPQEAERALNVYLGQLDKEGYGEITFKDRLKSVISSSLFGIPSISQKDLRSKNLKEAIEIAGNNDPRGYRNIDSSTYTKASDRVQGIFRKLLTDPKNKDRAFQKTIYDLAGQSNDVSPAQVLDALFEDREGGDLALTMGERSELRDFVRRNGDASLKGLYAEEFKRTNNNSNYGMRNSFIGLANKGDRYKNIKFEGKGGYEETVGFLKQQLTGLKGMSPEQAKEWLSKNKENLIYNAEIATGNRNFGESLARSVEVMSGLNSDDYKAYMNQGWFKTMDISTADNESTKKQLGMSTDNPNTEAVKSLTAACNALAKAIGG